MKGWFVLQFADDGHATDETLERFVMNRLADPELATLEEHLLVCDTCQDRLAVEDSIRQGVRDGAVVLDRPHTAPLWRTPKLAWVFGVLAMGLVAFAGSNSWRYLRHSGTPAVVLLRATRGTGIANQGAVSAGRPLRLIPDLTDLPAFSEYGVEIVDGGGHAVYHGRAAIQNSRLEVRLTNGLNTGAYFARVLSPAGDLLREYALIVSE